MKARAPLASVRFREGGTSLPSALRRRGVHGPHVVVLVAVVVLHVEDEAAVPGPEEARDGPLRLGGHAAGRLEGLGRLLDPDVAGVAPRLEEGDVLAVRGELGRRDLRVAEEELAVEDRAAGRSAAAAAPAAKPRARARHAKRRFERVESWVQSLRREEDSGEGRPPEPGVDRASSLTRRGVVELDHSSDAYAGSGVGVPSDVSRRPCAFTPGRTRPRSTRSVVLGRMAPNCRFRSTSPPRGRPRRSSRRPADGRPRVGDEHRRRSAEAVLLAEPVSSAWRHCSMDNRPALLIRSRASPGSW